jgi:hypothetical protein
MNIETELTRIENAKTAIYNAIIEKGGTVSSTAKISEYAAAINSLPSTSDTDFSVITATGSDIRSRKTVY